MSDFTSYGFTSEAEAALMKTAAEWAISNAETRRKWWWIKFSVVSAVVLLVVFQWVTI